ncbi:MAG: nucleotide exchange factor GrpE [Eubacterium sp.]|nr:nucleotide exchange factor GrpE [Eubacterium sp.]
METSGEPAEEETAVSEESAEEETGADGEPAEAGEEDDGDSDDPSEDVSKDDGKPSRKSAFGSKKDKKKKSARVLEVELEKAEAKAADLTDRYQRLMAEFENARKRMEKEKSQMFDIGAKAVLEKLLPVVDNFERGLSALSEEEKEDPFAQGIEKIYQQLMTTFTDLGVTAMDAAGKEFNPDLHNAVMHVEDEELPENVVAEEFQKGYMYKESVLRHAMVKVAN